MNDDDMVRRADAEAIAERLRIPVDQVIGRTVGEVRRLAESLRPPPEPIPDRWSGSGATWSRGGRLYIHRQEVSDGTAGRPLAWARIPLYTYRWDLHLDGHCVGSYPGVAEAMAAGDSLAVRVQP